MTSFQPSDHRNENSWYCLTKGPAANQKPEYIGEQVYIPVRSPMYFTSTQTFKPSTSPARTRPEGLKQHPPNQTTKRQSTKRLPQTRAIKRSHNGDLRIAPGAEASYQVLLQHQLRTTAGPPTTPIPLATDYGLPIPYD
ncbi:unnamed protein product [Macrosiphum euphorbiae]|uniref:Uncharacterized protein n=1 Tax=Macrosiphum euphorbiae TaxID=13131 RepID=A0AAV0W8W1_9HEMI|nr:unnamed protein product [Macrosiphum euphorbiae]